MIQLTDVTVYVNDEAVPINPNTLAWNEGFGERTMRVASIGDGAVEQVYANNVESAFSMVKFEMPTTPETVALARAWLANENQNVVQLSGSTPEGDVTRTFNRAAIVNNPEVGAGTETSIEVEFNSDRAI